MSNSGLILQIVALVFGSGAVQLAIFLFRRRVELRKTSTESDVNTSTAVLNTSSATEKLINQLTADGATYREITKDLEAKFERLRKEQEDAQHEFARQLDVAHSENRRLVMRVAQLQNDLDISSRQLDDIRRLRQ